MDLDKNKEKISTGQKQGVKIPYNDKKYSQNSFLLV